MNKLILKPEQLQKILEKIYHQKIKILNISRLGSGFMAVGFQVDYKIQGKIKKLVIRVLSSVNFSNDYAADRMGSFWIQHHSAKMLPSHIKSIGIIGFDKKNKKTEIVDHFNEFFQILEFAEGEEYFVDLERILEDNHLTKQDLNRIKLLSEYLANIHQKKFKGPEDKALSLYKRHTRDYIGSRFLFDVLDTYPDEFTFANWNQIHKLVFEIYIYREKFKNNFLRLSNIHGDFHPGNIKFKKNDKFSVLDASRVIWGEPADDVTCLSINYLWYALKQNGKFTGVFREMFDLFMKNYFKKSHDKELVTTLPLFFAIRGVVLNHPLYFSVDDKLRKKLLGFSFKILKGKNIEEALDS